MRRPSPGRILALVVSRFVTDGELHRSDGDAGPGRHDCGRVRPGRATRGDRQRGNARAPHADAGSIRAGLPGHASAPDDRPQSRYSSAAKEHRAAYTTWLRFVAAGVLFAALAIAQTPPMGPEFQVNTYTTAWQFWPVVASDPAGNFVVVWNSNGQDGSYNGIFGRRYDSSGNPRGRVPGQRLHDGGPVLSRRRHGLPPAISSSSG